MIDQVARRALARQVRAFFTRRLSSHALDDALDAFRGPGVRDPVIAAGRSRTWCFYDDTRDELLDETTTRLWRREVARLILFLQTSSPYSWPRVWLDEETCTPVYRHLFSRENIARRRVKEYADWARSGDEEIWPFRNRAEYAHALRRPPFLSGRSRARLVSMKSPLTDRVPNATELGENARGGCGLLLGMLFVLGIGVTSVLLQVTWKGALITLLAGGAFRVLGAIAEFRYAEAEERAEEEFGLGRCSAADPPQPCLAGLRFR